MITTEMNKLASVYLPTVRHAIQVISQQPDLGEFLRKYNRLRDILENPANQPRQIKPNQLKSFEQLLMCIQRDPFHLINQQRKSASAAAPNQAKAAAAAAVEAAAISAGAHPHVTSKQLMDVQQQQADGTPMDVGPEHRPRTVGQQQQQQQQQLYSSQLLNRFRGWSADCLFYLFTISLRLEGGN